jgi:hypothetical protein
MAKSDKLATTRLYLDLARDCLNSVARAKRPEEAEELSRLCRCFISEAEEALNSVDAVPSSG